MSYEIDFLALQSVAKSGDAICMRYGRLQGLVINQRIVVVDAGHSDDGQSVVNHIQTYYNDIFLQGSPSIDLLVSTHPDSDHIGGLRYILDNISVRELWIHQPWLHAANIRQYIDDGRYTTRGIKSRLQTDLDSAYDLVQTARGRGVIVREPFRGLTGLGGVVHVLGPTENFYHQRLAEYRLGGTTLPALPNPGLTFENFATESLDAGGGTSPMNETSVILWIQIPDGDRLLLTGDAGILGLSEALVYAYQIQINPTLADVVQIPHHGSRRNVSPIILNAMLGEPPGEAHQPIRTAVVSCAANGSPKHPSSRVLNAFTRRRCSTLKTAGRDTCVSRNAPVRSSYSSVSGIGIEEFVTS